ncbi:hypothetical protein E7Y31_12820 [Candidatus Frankia alpina]|uniref:Oligopeptide/dipeptide ABC transporter C-terminal domain-containing protein n=1 Tax=Candidatus Frankia alpina TaxID=2699483 RepID=A0A4S5EQB2_9ACTN|nr:hypothetical protein E7Y31_12820 [Candidatus Frankia alpina]
MAPPSLINVPPGCPFHPRCTYRELAGPDDHGVPRRRAPTAADCGAFCTVWAREPCVSYRTTSPTPTLVIMMSAKPQQASGRSGLAARSEYMSGTR